MKKIHLTEGQIHNLFSTLRLPQWLFKKVKKHETFLGDNEAFPPVEDYPFDYKILKLRFEEVYNEISTLNLESLEEEYLTNRLTDLIHECKKIEEPIKENLEKICINTVIELLNVPEETVNLSCKLVDKINPQHNSYRTLPEDSSNRTFDFEDLDEINDISKTVLKRRLINALIQGASYTYSKYYDLYLSKIYELDKRLINLYNQIIILNDYLLFIKDFKIDDKHPMQSAYVEVLLGNKGNKTEILAQGLLFPFLLMETIRGFFELFASHGLPEDNEKAMYIIKQADFLCAEPWDLRMGVGLWKYISNEIDDTTLLPYIFTTLCEIPTQKFNATMQEIFAHTKKSKAFLNDIKQQAKEEADKLNFIRSMKQKNDDVAILNDGFISVEDLDGILLDEADKIGEIDDKINPTILGKCNPLDITFEVGNATPSFYQGDKNIYQLYPVYNNHEFQPSEGIYFRAEDVMVNDQHYYQLHIEIDESLRRQGIAQNLYTAFILQGYPACDIFNNRTASFNKEHGVATKNDIALPSLWEKINQHPNISIEPLYNKANEEIGIKAVLN